MGESQGPAQHGQHWPCCSQAQAGAAVLGGEGSG